LARHSAAALLFDGVLFFFCCFGCAPYVAEQGRRGDEKKGVESVSSGGFGEAKQSNA